MFFFNDTANTEIYTLSLHDALPIWRQHPVVLGEVRAQDLELLDRLGVRDRLVGVLDRGVDLGHELRVLAEDRKSTRLNSSHANISYAVFCLKKKTQNW